MPPTVRIGTPRAFGADITNSNGTSPVDPASPTAILMQQAYKSSPGMAGQLEVGSYSLDAIRYVALLKLCVQHDGFQAHLLGVVR